jgi:hypothetical protein
MDIALMVAALRNSEPKIRTWIDWIHFARTNCIFPPITRLSGRLWEGKVETGHLPRQKTGGVVGNAPMSEGMNMVYRGTVTRGVVVLQDGVHLPEGTTVSVEPIEEALPAGKDDAVYRVSELAVPTGIDDLALNADHYLYGHPKGE